MISQDPMVYLRDCVPDLINALRAAHQHDEPSSPLPDAKTLGSLLDVAFGASMEPEEGRFATFGLGLIPARGPQAPYKELRFTSPRELCATEVVRLAAGTDSITTSLAVWPEPDGALHIWGLITSESQAVGSAPLHGHPTFLLHAPFLVVRARAPGVLYVYYRRQLHLLYVRGTAHFLLSSGRLQEILRDDAYLQPLDANALSQIATRISLLGHGGTLLLTDPEADVVNRFAGRLVPLRPAQPRPSGRRSRPYRQCRRQAGRTTRTRFRRAAQPSRRCCPLDVRPGPPWLRSQDQVERRSQTDDQRYWESGCAPDLARRDPRHAPPIGRDVLRAAARTGPGDRHLSRRRCDLVRTTWRWLRPENRPIRPRCWSRCGCLEAVSGRQGRHHEFFPVVRRVTRLPARRTPT